MKNIEKFGISNITDPIKNTGNKAGSSITGGFKDVGNFFTGDFTDFFTGIGDFFKNIFGAFSQYLNMLSWICFIIICLFCCFLSSPIIMPMLSLGSLVTKTSSSSSIDF